MADPISWSTRDTRRSQTTSGRSSTIGLARPQSQVAPIDRWNPAPVPDIRHHASTGRHETLLNTKAGPTGREASDLRFANLESVASSAIRSQLTIGSESRFGMNSCAPSRLRFEAAGACRPRHLCRPSKHPGRCRCPNGAATSPSTARLLLMIQQRAPDGRRGCFHALAVVRADDRFRGSLGVSAAIAPATKNRRECPRRSRGCAQSQRTTTVSPPHEARGRGARPEPAPTWSPDTDFRPGDGRCGWDSAQCE